MMWMASKCSDRARAGTCSGGAADANGKGHGPQALRGAAADDAPHAAGPWSTYYSGKARNQHRRSDGVAELVTELRLRGARTVLDFACGTGRNALFLAEQGFGVHGFDMEPEAIRIASEKASAARVQAEFAVQDMRMALPYPDGFFDAVVIVRAMYHERMPTILRIANELVRTIAPDGLVYMESDQSDSAKYHQAYEWVEGEDGTYLITEGKFKGIYYHYFTEDELGRLFPGCEVSRIEFDRGNFSMLARKVA